MCCINALILLDMKKFMIGAILCIACMGTTFAQEHKRCTEKTKICCSKKQAKECKKGCKKTCKKAIKSSSKEQVTK